MQAKVSPFMKYFRSYTDALRRISPIAILSTIAVSGPVWAENPLGKVVYILDFCGKLKYRLGNKDYYWNQNLTSASLQ
jgi:hypothetical protein